MAFFIHGLFRIMPNFDSLILHSFTPLYSSLFTGKRETRITDLQMECCFCYNLKFTHENDHQDCSKLVMKRENRMMIGSIAAKYSVLLIPAILLKTAHKSLKGEIPSFK